MTINGVIPRFCRSRIELALPKRGDYRAKWTEIQIIGTEIGVIFKMDRF